MKKTIILFVIIAVFFALNACDKDNTDNDIVYQSVNKNYILVPDMQQMSEHDNSVAQHIDSILNGYIDAELISTGYIRFDLDFDSINDFAFEIINLQAFNNNQLPEEFDSLAVRAHPFSGSILDNSTFQYADALSLDEEISSTANWTTYFVVLGTFMNAGQFNGKGEKYLGIRLNGETGYKYGWIKIYVSEHNDTLRIIDYAYNNIEGSFIRAGQKE
jgi:hypothetical protein